MPLPRRFLYGRHISATPLRVGCACTDAPAPHPPQVAWMPGGWRLAVAGITAGIAVSVVIYMRRRSRRTLLPVTCTDKKGTSVIVRIATLDDRPQVASHIADQTGTGSGVGNDDYLLQEFERMVGDPTTTMLFVEDEAGTGLGMMCVVWSSPTESYWQSLRVSQSARGRGIAQLLFNIAAKLALERQGPHSVSRWGVVSSNEIMTTWSKRLGLEGPQLFRRHGAKATATPPTLPPDYVLRPATVADVPLIMRRMAEFPVASSSFSSQNFVASGCAPPWMPGATPTPLPFACRLASSEKPP